MNTASTTTIVLLLAAALFAVGILAADRPPGATQPATRPNLSAAEKLGWRLGMQAYTFRLFTFHQAVDKTASLGLKYIEAYPGQRLSKDKPDLTMHHNMKAEVRREVKKKLQTAGVKLVNYGVVSLGRNEKSVRRVFDFAKDMGIETIVAEPDPKAMDLVEKLCEEYKINVAIHNHPKPSRYWNPDAVLTACKGRSRRIGACADTGHWMRSGLDPVESLRKLKGRIVCLHFKDLSGARGGHDAPWGTGKGRAEEMLSELRRQGFRGVFSVEYEHNWKNSMPDIAKCVAYFARTARHLSEANMRKNEGIQRSSTITDSTVAEPGSRPSEE